MEEVEVQGNIVQLLDNTPRTYSEVWGATVHFAQEGIVDEVGYWLGLYRIKRDASWMEADYQDQNEWLFAINNLPRYEGGCPRSIFFNKMSLIEDMISRGITPRMIVHALTQPTATEKLLKNTDKLPEGKSVQSVLEETEGMNPGKASTHVSEIVHESQEWVGDMKYDMKQQKLIIPICEQDEEMNLDIRQYVMYNIPYEDALFLAKRLKKSMEAY